MKLAEVVMAFARARTRDDRIFALKGACRSRGLSEADAVELRNLLSEAQQMQPTSLGGLRPKPNLSRDCPELTPLEAGPCPELPAGVRDEVDEWAKHWGHVTELIAAGIALPGPILLHGPSGTGKTMLSRYIAGCLDGVGAYVLDAHNVIESYMGKTGERLGRIFRALDEARALLVIEELDALSEPRKASSGDGGTASENNRITVALMRMVESARFPIVATTNRIDALDPALIRRLEYKIELPPLLLEQRRRILRAEIGGGELPEAIANPCLDLHEALPMCRRERRRQFLAGERR